MTARTTGTADMTQRFALTLGWAGPDSEDAATVALDIRAAARLHEALSVWLTEVDEDVLFEACMAWHRDTVSGREDDSGELDGGAA
jgi:hypothetical protein